LLPATGTLGLLFSGSDSIIPANAAISLWRLSDSALMSLIERKSATGSSGSAECVAFSIAAVISGPGSELRTIQLGENHMCTPTFPNCVAGT
jgi:hypothetical protein